MLTTVTEGTDWEGELPDLRGVGAGASGALGEALALIRFLSPGSSQPVLTLQVATPTSGVSSSSIFAVVLLLHSVDFLSTGIGYCPMVSECLCPAAPTNVYRVSEGSADVKQPPVQHPLLEASFHLVFSCLLYQEKRGGPSL